MPPSWQLPNWAAICIAQKIHHRAILSSGVDLPASQTSNSASSSPNNLWVNERLLVRVQLTIKKLVMALRPCLARASPTIFLEPAQNADTVRAGLAPLGEVRMHRAPLGKS